MGLNLGVGGYLDAQSPPFLGVPGMSPKDLGREAFQNSQDQGEGPGHHAGSGLWLLWEGFLPGPHLPGAKPRGGSAPLPTPKKERKTE